MRSSVAIRSADNGQPAFGSDYMDSFEVDHLISFTGVPHMEMDPHAGIAKLRQRQERTGILTLRCLMALAVRNNRKVIIIKNRQTREEMETFPLSIVSNLYHQTSSDPREPYNRKVIMVLSRSPVPSRTEENAPEMHVFQSIFLPASEIVERILLFKNSEVVGPSYQPQDDHLGISMSQEDRAKSMGSVTSTVAGRFQQGLGALQNWGQGVAERTSADPTRVDKEIYLLNRCFEAIEMFVGKLRHAVDLYKSNRLRANKKGSVKINNLLRAQLPNRMEFVECFKLIKLSLVLLTRLNGVITGSPSPEDSLHSLIAVLQVVTDASREPNTKEPTLARSIVSPLLLKDTVDMLESSLREDEKRLWKELGEAWSVPRELWRGSFVPCYLPVFNDGFTPTLWDYDESIFIQTPQNHMSSRFIQPQQWISAEEKGTSRF